MHAPEAPAEQKDQNHCCTAALQEWDKFGCKWEKPGKGGAFGLRDLQIACPAILTAADGARMPVRHSTSNSTWLASAAACLVPYATTMQQAAAAIRDESIAARQPVPIIHIEVSDGVAFSSVGQVIAAAD